MSIWLFNLCLQRAQFHPGTLDDIGKLETYFQTTARSGRPERESEESEAERGLEENREKRPQEKRFLPHASTEDRKLEE